jgi:beta-lactamase regulating signal transducer with metallopeptidase domain
MTQDLLKLAQDVASLKAQMSNVFNKSPLISEESLTNVLGKIFSDTFQEERKIKLISEIKTMVWVFGILTISLCVTMIALLLFLAE